MPEIGKVYGPPGTGKTTYLINKVEEEINNGVQPDEIIYTSFTRAAAYEARDRALSKFTGYVKSDFPWFSTIHSICFRLLGITRLDIFTGSQIKDFCREYGYQLSSENQEPTEEADSDMPHMVLATTADYFEHFISWMRNQMARFSDAVYYYKSLPGIPDDFNEQSLLLYIHRRNDYKAQKHLVDFTDMIEMSLGQGVYPSGTKVLISDEYQDLSRLLARLMDYWGTRMERVYMAGDPYQAIYQFMAADPTIFIKAKAGTSVVLKQSYRCSPQVHAVSRKLVSRFATRYTDDDFSPTHNPGFVSRQVPEAIDWPHLNGSVFYIHRTNWLVSQAYKQLVEEGVPFMTLRGRKSPIQSTKARAINTVMRLADGREVTLGDVVKALEFIPSKGKKGENLQMGAKTKMKEMAKDSKALEVKSSDLISLGFTPQFMKVLTKELAPRALHLEKEEQEYFIRLISRFGYGVLNAEPKVVLATIHGVKGKEADTVILNCNLTHRTYDSFIFDPEPEHRLFYVGVTRARTCLMLIEPEDYEAYTI